MEVRALAALAKGLTMGALGVWVLVLAGWHIATGAVPEPRVMGVVGFAALLANVACLALLTGFRRGDANMRSAWICTRNDVLGNLAVLVAAAGVFGTGSGWPDAAVAGIMAALAIQGAVVVTSQSLAELSSPRPMSPAE